MAVVPPLAHSLRTPRSTHLHLSNIAASRRRLSLLSERPSMDWHILCICALRGGRRASRRLERCLGVRGRIDGRHGRFMRLLVCILSFSRACDISLTFSPFSLFPSMLALMEYHCSDEKNVASRIFERGLELFAHEVEFVLRYLGFLISINDDNSPSLSFSSRIRILTQRPF